MWFLKFNFSSVSSPQRLHNMKETNPVTSLLKFPVNRIHFENSMLLKWPFFHYFIDTIFCSLCPRQCHFFLFFQTVFLFSTCSNVFFLKVQMLYLSYATQQNIYLQSYFLTDFITKRGNMRICITVKGTIIYRTHLQTWCKWWQTVPVNYIFLTRNSLRDTPRNFSFKILISQNKFQ